MSNTSRDKKDDEANERFLKLLENASGHWAHIFEDLAPELAEALSVPGEHVPCPVHGGQNGFRLFPHFNETGRGYCNTCGPKNSGPSLLAWVKNYPLSRSVKEVAAWLEKNKGTIHERPLRPEYVPKPKIDPLVARAKLLDVWHSSVPLVGTPAETYLVHRGIWRENLPSTLRAHPGLPYYHLKDKKTEYLGTFPCLLAPIINRKNEVASLHRIFLSHDGKSKAPVPDAKKMMSPAHPLQGAAIRLHNPYDGILGVAEGIETALAVHAITRLPMWSCVSATLLELVDIPPSVRHVVIWADLDVSQRGIQAAEALAKRVEANGMTCEICLPFEEIPEGSKGVDWLDVLRTRGINGFPAKWRKWRPGMTKPD